MVAVCVWTWSLILARSTGQATTSWAAPPAHPAQKISQFVGFTEEERPPEEIPVLKAEPTVSSNINIGFACSYLVTH